MEADPAWHPENGHPRAIKGPAIHFRDCFREDLHSLRFRAPNHQSIATPSRMKRTFGRIHLQTNRPFSTDASPRRSTEFSHQDATGTTSTAAMGGGLDGLARNVALAVPRKPRPRGRRLPKSTSLRHEEKQLHADLCWLKAEHLCIVAQSHLSMVGYETDHTSIRWPAASLYVLDALQSLYGTRTLLEAKGIAARSKDATRGSWPYYFTRNDATTAQYSILAFEGSTFRFRCVLCCAPGGR